MNNYDAALSIITMFDDGLPLEDISKKTGISECDLSYLLLKMKRIVGGKHIVRDFECVYPKLKAWMIVNGISVAELSRQAKISHRECMALKLAAKRQFKMNEINTILELTNMTYEECFSTNTSEVEELG